MDREGEVVQRENHLIFNYADFSLFLIFFSVLFFVLEAKQLGIANTLEINTRATPPPLLLWHCPQLRERCKDAERERL